MDIKKFLKPKKDIVIDIDEVEYLLDREAIRLIGEGAQNVELLQLYDHQLHNIKVKEIESSLTKKGGR